MRFLSHNRQPIRLGTSATSFLVQFRTIASLTKMRNNNNALQTNSGQCDTSAAHCDPATCLKSFSGTGSSCAVSYPIVFSIPDFVCLLIRFQGAPAQSFASEIPVIDVCGSAKGGVSCPGAGLNVNIPSINMHRFLVISQHATGLLLPLLLRRRPLRPQEYHPESRRLLWHRMPEGLRQMRYSAQTCGSDYSTGNCRRWRDVRSYC